jgi:hypothetical protein
MPARKLVTNSLEAQLQEVADQFSEVQSAAEKFEGQQTRATELLHLALADLYAFGESLTALSTDDGRSMAEAFVTSKGLPWGKVMRGNPYTGLAKLAFAKQLPASISQYAAVLRLASDRGIVATDFRAWLADNDGIKGRYNEAVDHFGSTRRQLGSQAKQRRIEKATQTLLGRVHSSAVALPIGIEAPEGFALVLARIDGSNNATIIDVVNSEAAAIEPILLRYETSKATTKSIMAAKPMGQFYRAIDLVAGCTPEKSGGHDRDILILNTHDRGRPVCRVEALSKAYTYPWAGMTIEGHLAGLNIDLPIVMAGSEAAYFRDSFADHEGWTFSVGGEIDLCADGLASPIKAVPLADRRGYRVGQSPADSTQRIRVAQALLPSLRRFLDDRRAENDRLNGTRKEKLSFTPTLRIQIEGGELLIGIPKMLGTAISFGETAPDRDLDQRAIGTADIERLIDTLIPYETDIEGAFLDTDVADAALCFDVPFDDDRLSITIPLLAGTAYCPSCEGLQV